MTWAVRPSAEGEVMVLRDRRGLDRQRDLLTPPRPRGGPRHSVWKPGCCVASSGAVRATPLVWNCRSGPRDAVSGVWRSEVARGDDVSISSGMPRGAPQRNEDSQDAILGESGAHEVDSPHRFPAKPQVMLSW
ncbi:hypothetical protein FKM82_007141 [Ascaphus truei]